MSGQFQVTTQAATPIESISGQAIPIDIWSSLHAALIGKFSIVDATWCDTLLFILVLNRI